MRTGRAWISIAACLTVALAVLLAGPLALASKRHRPLRAGVTITLTHDDMSGDFVGTLASPQSACIVDRTVDLWAFGTSASNSPVLVGTTTTDSSGNYTFHEPNAQAGFYGTTTPKVTHHRHRRLLTCMAGSFPAQNF